MNIEELRLYCLSKLGAEESFPFDEVTLAFKVGGKMFAITNIAKEELSVNLKCDPEKAIQLREEYAEVIAGYHMSKKHWNTVQCEGTVGDSLIKEWIDHSYDLVYSKLPKRIKDQLNEN